MTKERSSDIIISVRKSYGENTVLNDEQFVYYYWNNDFILNTIGISLLFFTSIGKLDDANYLRITIV